MSNQDLHYLFVLFVLECEPVIFLISLRLLYVLKYMCMCVYYSLWNLHLLHTWLLILVHIYYVHLYLLFVCVLTIVSIQQIGRRYGYQEKKLNRRHGICKFQGNMSPSQCNAYQPDETKTMFLGCNIDKLLFFLLSLLVISST